MILLWGVLAFFNLKSCVSDRLGGRTISFLYQRYVQYQENPLPSTGIQGPGWFLNAEALQNILLELADPDALP